MDIEKARYENEQKENINKALQQLEEYMKFQHLLNNPYHNMPEQESAETCSKCLSQLTECYSDGSLTCSNCGFEQQATVFDIYAEWNNYLNDDGTSKDNTARCSGFQPSILQSDSGSISTGIGGNIHKHKRMVQLSLQKKVNYSEKVLMDLDKLYSTYFDESGVNIPEFVRHEAVLIFSDYRKQENPRTNQARTNRGKNLLGIQIACLIQACTNNNIILSTRKICEIFHCKPAHITNGKRLLNEYRQLMHIKVDNVRIVNPEDLVPEYCNKLSLPFKLRSEILELVKQINSIKNTNKDLRTARPQTIASACLWITIVNNQLDQVFDEHSGISRHHITQVSGVSDGTFMPIVNVITTLKNPSE